MPFNPFTTPTLLRLVTTSDQVGPSGTDPAHSSSPSPKQIVERIVAQQTGFYIMVSYPQPPRIGDYERSPLLRQFLESDLLTRLTVTPEELLAVDEQDEQIAVTVRGILALHVSNVTGDYSGRMRGAWQLELSSGQLTFDPRALSLVTARVR